jgi:plasmid rolling circle replication initiator protein Rep
MTLRRNDILKRREVFNSKIFERNELIKEKEMRDERRKIELEEYKKSFEGIENPEENNYDAKAFLENWDNVNKEIIIPPPVLIDTDDDFYIATQ